MNTRREMKARKQIQKLQKNGGGTVYSMSEGGITHGISGGSGLRFLLFEGFVVYEFFFGSNRARR